MRKREKESQCVNLNDESGKHLSSLLIRQRNAKKFPSTNNFSNENGFERRIYNHDGPFPRNPSSRGTPLSLLPHAAQKYTAPRTAAAAAVIAADRKRIFKNPLKAVDTKNRFPADRLSAPQLPETKSSEPDRNLNRRCGRPRSSSPSPSIYSIARSTRSHHHRDALDAPTLKTLEFFKFARESRRKSRLDSLEDHPDPESARSCETLSRDSLETTSPALPRSRDRSRTSSAFRVWSADRSTVLLLLLFL